MKFAQRYKTDQKAEREGKWFDWGNGGKTCIARIGNPAYKEMLREEMKQFDSLRRAGRSIPEEATNEILIKCMAHTIVLGWEGYSGEGLEGLGLTFNQDMTIPYSPENAIILLKEFKDFRDEIATIATDMENFLAESEAAIAKNSKTS